MGENEVVLPPACSVHESVEPQQSPVSAHQALLGEDMEQRTLSWSARIHSTAIGFDIKDFGGG